MENYQHIQAIDLTHILPIQTKTEQRKYPRYKMNGNVLSISDDVLAQVVDLSGSGISFQCPTIVGEKMNKIGKILLLNCQFGTSVEELACKMVRSSNKINSQTLPAKIIMNCSLEFENLSKSKRKQLFQFINECSKQENVMQKTI